MGIASKTQTFHQMAVFVLFASCDAQCIMNYKYNTKHLNEQLTSAHSAALYVFRIVLKRMMYVHPIKRLNNAHIRDSSAEYRVTGSSEAPGICKIVTMALANL